MTEDLGYVAGYLGEKDKGRDLIDVKVPGLKYSLPVVKYAPEGGLSFPWLPRDSNEKTASAFGDILQQTMPEGVADTFKYSLERNPSMSYYEDPTYLSYDLIFDVENSPLFDVKHPNGIYNFLIQYQNMKEVSNRLTDSSDNNALYDEFMMRFFDIFQTGFDNSGEAGGFQIENRKPRAYYAEAISGLEKLNEKIVKYGEDKLTITLTEDISMTALYLAELYNNLVYSYKSQKFMIPDNCVRFDMLVKISDMRNFKIPNPNFNATNDTSLSQPHKSHIIYRLHDCNFDFFNSMNIPNDLAAGGFNASLDQNPAKITFEIYYKSISREMSPDLIENGIIIRNKMIDLSDPVSQDKTMFAPGADAAKAYQDKLLSTNRNKTTVIPALGDLTTSLQNRYKEVRGEMLSELLQTVKTGLGIKFHQPPNVYEDDIFEGALDFVKSLLGKEKTTSAEVKRAQERLSTTSDIDGIPPSDLDPNYHRFT